MSSEIFDPAPSSEAADPHIDDTPPARLQGDMGTAAVVFSVLGFNAPLQWTAGLLPLVIAYGAGVGAPLVFVLIGALMMTFAVGYAAMSRTIPRAGALYTFVTAGLGRPLGLGASFLALLGYGGGVVFLAIFAGFTLESEVADTLHLTLPWWITALGFALIVGILGYRRIDVSARVVGILVAIEFTAVVIYNIAVGANGGATGRLSFSSFTPSELTGSSLILGSIFAILAFVGFETTAVFRDEVRDPRRTIPRATYFTIALLTVFTAVGSWLIIQAIGADNAVTTLAPAPAIGFYDTVRTYLGGVAVDFVTVLIITSAFASMATVHNVVARYLFSMAADGVLPRRLATPHPRYGSPAAASLCVSVYTVVFLAGTALSGANPISVYTVAGGSLGLQALALFALAAVAIAAYMWRTKPADTSVWHRVVAPLIAALTLIALVIAAVFNMDTISGSRTLAVVAVALVVGCVLLGVVVAQAFRIRRPEVYDRIGTRE